MHLSCVAAFYNMGSASPVPALSSQGRAFVPSPHDALRPRENPRDLETRLSGAKADVWDGADVRFIDQMAAIGSLT